MTTFTKYTIVKQLLIFLCLFFLSILSLTFGVSAYLSYVKESQSTALSALVNYPNFNNTRQLSGAIKAVFNPEKIEIRRPDHSVSVQYKDDNLSRSFFRHYYQLFDSTAGDINATSKKTNVRVEVKLRLHPLYRAMDTALLFLFLAFAIMTSVSSYLNIKMTAWSHKFVAEKVSAVITHFIQQDKKDVDWQSFPEEIGEIISPLKRLGGYINRQYADIHTTAESLKNEAMKDPLTGFPNKNRFIQFYEETLREEDTAEFGVLAMVRASELMTINQARGYQAGDDYIIKIAQLIKAASIDFKSPLFYRLNGSDFGVLLPHVTLREAEAFGKNLSRSLTEYQRTTEWDAIAYTGLTPYTAGQSLSELLAVTDTAVSLAQTREPNAWQMMNHFDGFTHEAQTQGNQNWRKEIENVIENRRVKLETQGIFDGQEAQVYTEVRARFASINGDTLPTGSLIAMAEKLDKIIALDKMIIKTTFEQLIDIHSDVKFGININARSIQDEQFAQWLERLLIREKVRAGHVVFEMSEYAMLQHVKASRQLIKRIQECGAEVTVERFGMGLTSFKFFSQLKPDYVKMDGIYTRSIDHDKNNQNFLRMMIDLAHSIGVKILTESVETEQEKRTLLDMGVDGIQGYHVARPEKHL